MVSPKSQCIRLPGEENRELWLGDSAGAWKRAETDDGRAGGLWAIECIALDSAPFWSLSSKSAGVSLEETAALHWEALGLTEEAWGRTWACWQVDDEQHQALAGTAALVPGDDGTPWRACMPEAFDVSARLFELPASEMAVWKELGRYVVAFQRGQGVVHFSVLQSRELNADAAWEIRDLALSLEVRGFIHQLHGCRVWTQAGDAFTSTLKEALGVRVRTEAKPAPQLPKVHADLLPPEAGRLREERTRRKRMAGWIALACLAYVLFFGGWTGLLFFREHRLQKAGDLQAKLTPEVDAVREAQNRWYALEPATNRDRYPVEIFYQIVSMIPDEGIRLTDFTMDEEKVAMTGQARSVGLAIKFKDDLLANPALKHYAWSFPQPSAGEDGRANFNTQGLLQGGSTP
ncbi:hypothetical protein DES53_105358 [Roseimicrobium gellanilyticum]|uniref:Uncharacterized protein n=1 Tax=Roseimicrobium gellanilyticum TaxID=748857 RepID=A0A366HM01_9BACT|nr:hypothetical protein [Roseimicrobium gellanilyticum]RBP43959.1 hypothetical protein DES53_105358 [Roseimicrobium gellanilyticum]